MAASNSESATHEEFTSDDWLPERSIAVAQVVLRRGRENWLWVVLTCPYCGKQHDHFGGPLDADPQPAAGRTFVARCDRTDRRRLSVDYPAAALWYQFEIVDEAALGADAQPLRRRGALLQRSLEP